jgi:hypothetical protein
MRQKEFLPATCQRAYIGSVAFILFCFAVFCWKSDIASEIEGNKNVEPKTGFRLATLGE